MDALHPIKADTKNNTKRIGTASEAAAMLRFLQRGCRVSIPFGEESPYDLIVETPGGRLLRVQVKTGRLRAGVVRFAAVSSHVHRGGKSARYDGKIDAFAVFCPGTNGCYLIDIDDVCVRGGSGWLRVDPPRNNMKRRIHWAHDYLMSKGEGSGTRPEPSNDGALDED